MSDPLVHIAEAVAADEAALRQKVKANAATIQTVVSADVAKVESARHRLLPYAIGGVTVAALIVVISVLIRLLSGAH
jgi:hypothetical protein